MKAQRPFIIFIPWKVRNESFLALRLNSLKEISSSGIHLHLQSSLDLGLHCPTCPQAQPEKEGGGRRGGAGMSQAPVTWQAPASPPHPRPHPPCRRRGPTRRPPPRTPGHWQASPSRPSLLPPSNGRGAGQAEQAAAAQPGLRPVPGSRAGPRRPLNAALGRHGAALATFFLGRRQRHPEEESSLDSAAPSRPRRLPPTLGPAPPPPPLPTPPPPPPPGPAGPVGAGPPGVRARVPARVCAPQPASDPRLRPAQDRPGIPARASRPTSPAARPPAAHPAAPREKMAGSVADSDAVVVSAGQAPPSRGPHGPAAGSRLAEAQPRAPGGRRRPSTWLEGAGYARPGSGEGWRGAPWENRWLSGGVGGGLRVGVSYSPLRTVQPPARCECARV